MKKSRCSHPTAGNLVCTAIYLKDKVVVLLKCEDCGNDVRKQYAEEEWNNGKFAEDLKKKIWV